MDITGGSGVFIANTFLRYVARVLRSKLKLREKLVPGKFHGYLSKNFAISGQFNLGIQGGIVFLSKLMKLSL